MSNSDDLSNVPMYNIRSVVERTGIAAETIRAWERRYAFPSPYRNSNGYRLYTEDEIAALNWLKNQTSSGLSIGQSVNLLLALRARGQSPVGSISSVEYPVEVEEDPAKVSQFLFEALISLNEEEANNLLRRSFAHLPPHNTLLDVISPTLVRIGEGWHDGEIPIAVEHFSTQLCRAHIIHGMETLPIKNGKGRIVAACAPGEWHEIGLLMVTFLLKDGGWSVTYLGANLSLERFSEVLANLKPHLVLFSASSPVTADNLSGLVGVLDQIEQPKPLIGLGGQAFLEDPTLANRIPGTFFGPRADNAVLQIEGILASTITHQ
jgi:MerR family transcriptional regulator, light-induced transcriptional regulator